MSLYVYIEPRDTVFFRDNRPFDAGVDTIAESIIPSPLTLFGVIGNYYLDINGISLKDFKDNGNTKLGNYDPELKNTRLKIKGPFFEYDEKVYLSTPANIWASGAESYVLKPRDRNNLEWDITQPDLQSLEIPRFGYGIQPETLGGFLSLEGIRQYLSMDEIDIYNNGKKEEDLFIKENRYGHQLNDFSQTVEEGQLYSARHIRFKDSLSNKKINKTKFMLVVDGLEGSDFTEKVTRVGGEGKLTGIYTEEKNEKLIPDNNRVLEKIKKGKKFLLYFITPAIFKEGWDRNWPVEFKDTKMVGACVNKPVFISGWQKSGKGMKGNPRSLFKTVPAGSVYFFKADTWDDNSFQALYEKYNFRESLSDFYPCAGFGTALIGAW
ncbi:MAG: type III-B CRISPR module-associated protein Cmr3 [bacterium]